MTPAMLPEFTMLAMLRILLFFGCHKFFLRSLYSDLRNLSIGPASDDIAASPGGSPHMPTRHSPISSLGNNEIELATLPTPVVAKSPKLSPSNDQTIRSAASVSRTVFSLVFVESCMMFFVLMLQGIGVLAPWIRLLSWKFSLASLIAIILVIVPLCFGLLFALGTKFSRGVSATTRRRLLAFRLFLGLLLVSLYLFFLSKIPLPSALLSSTGTSVDTFTVTLSRLIVLGTIILGLLSGFGAISNVWGYIPFFTRSQSIPRDLDVSRAEVALQSVRHDLRDRREAAKRQASVPVEGTWIGRVVPNLRGKDSSDAQELRGLEALEYQMSRNLESLRTRRDSARYARTIRGRIFNIGGRIFAVYCIIRIISSIVNIVFPSKRVVSSDGHKQATTSYPDLIAGLLTRMVSFFFVSSVDLRVEDVVSVARQVSLVLVGLIILTSVRRVLRGVTRVLRITSRNLGASFMMLFLAQLMGIYLLSTIVQLRNSFPPPPLLDSVLDLEDPITNPNPGGSGTVIITNLFMTIPEFEVFGSLFDWSFLIAVGGSAFVRWGAERLNGIDDI